MISSNNECIVVIVLIGPMGCGKTTIGKQLSEMLGWPFYDADDYHPQENVEKMRAGIPLQDEQRWLWLERLRDEIRKWQRQGQRSILACSALKKSYRDILGINQQTVVSVHLKGSFDLLLKRVQARRHRYMPQGLLRSQVETLEAPQSGLTVDISPSPSIIVSRIIESLKLDN